MRNRLVKLLNLTTSNFDGECINAIRSANAILEKEDMVWDDIFKGDYNNLISRNNFLEGEVIRLKSMSKSPVTIKSKIEECLRYKPDSNFLNSIYDSYEKYGRLTQKQEIVLNEIYNNL